MSLFRTQLLTCPNCGQENAAPVAGSINADRRPDLRDAIMENRFQDTTCERCETVFRMEPRFNYLSVAAGLWIAAMPGLSMADYLDEEDTVREVFEGSYGAGAPKPAQDIGAGLNVRLTFGWPALREKLLAASLGLDDVVLEEMKLDLLRRLPDAPMRPGVELRLYAMTDEGRMTLLWIETFNEEVLEQVEIDRALYDLIAADRDGWADVTASLTDGYFVDMQKLYMGQGRTDDEGTREAAAG